MPNDLVAFENELKPLAPRFEDVLAGIMPAERLMRTALISVERNPYLLQCNRQSFLNTIMSAAVLGLEMDGVTGQAFPIPFKGKVQLVIGYKGYVTLGARAGLTIDGQVVREGDEFDFEFGTVPFVRHKPSRGKGPIIAAWAAATAPNRTPVIAVMDIEEINAVRAKSPGAKRGDSPWNDEAIGFPAMASKTVKRRLCRSLPLNVMQLAARMEEAFDEQGRGGFIASDSTVIIDADEKDAHQTGSADGTPKVEDLTAERHVDDGLDYLREQGSAAARSGMDALQNWFSGLSKPEKTSIKTYLDTDLKPMAGRAVAGNEREIRADLWPLKIEDLNACTSLEEVNAIDTETKPIFAPYPDLAENWRKRCDQRRAFFVQAPAATASTAAAPSTYEDRPDPTPTAHTVAPPSRQPEPAEDFGF